MRFETKSIEREAGQCVADRRFVEGYCRVTYQPYDRVSSVLESCDRTEIYLWDEYANKALATVYMTAFMDMHHGEVGATLALFVMPEHQGKPDVARWVNSVIVNWCKENDIKKYQRSKHIDSHRQLIITKEV